ncbi:MAG: DNA internalization-related competence protein ComEC/Rec2, partial [Acidobacteriota bacterium]
MAAPFFFLGLSLAGGILTSSFFQLNKIFWAVILIVFLCGGWLSYSILRKLALAFILALWAAFSLGALLYTHQDQQFRNNQLHLLTSSDYIDFQGKLFRSPVKGRDRYYLFLKIEKTAYHNEEKEIKGRLRLTIPESKGVEKIESLHPGDMVIASAKLTPLREFRNFQSSNQIQFLKNQDIHNRAFTKSAQLIRKTDSASSYSLIRFISKLRQKARSFLEAWFSRPGKKGLAPEGAVLESLLLGERERLPENLSRSFQSAGLFHLFAISGAHIAIISFFLYSVFRSFRFSLRLSSVLLMFFLIFFAFFVEGRASVLRATIMTLFFLLGRLIFKDVHFLNTLGVSAFLLLFLNPSDLFHVGFQMTFGATLSIILFFPKIIKFLPVLPLRISELFAVSLAAQLGLLPLMITYFNRVTFTALFLNLGAVPLVGFIMGSGYIFLVFSFLPAFLMRAGALVLEFSVKTLIWLSQLSEHFPVLSFRIPTPHNVLILGYFISLLAVLIIPVKKKILRFALFFSFLIFFTLLVSHPFCPSVSSLTLTTIDVGQGQSILVEFPGKEKMLIDGGGFFGSSFDVGEKVVSPFLWRKGIKTIDYLVLTHAHPDHLNGLLAVARNFKIKHYWESSSPYFDETYSTFRKTLPYSVQYQLLSRGDIRKIGSTSIEILHPSSPLPNVSEINNDQSLVMRLVYGQTAFLFPGDITESSEKEIIQHYLSLDSQVLHSPHHGSNSSSSEA